MKDRERIPTTNHQPLTTKHQPPIASQREVEMGAYDRHWQEEVAALAAVLRGALDELAVRIDHIGSTSVPGLPAKDVIDIQVSVASLEPREPIVDALQRIGYTLRPDITGDHQPPGFVGDSGEWAKLYFRAPADQRRTHLHVRVAGRANQRYALLFREYLRAHPASAAGYAALKRSLARYHPDDMDTYATIKDPVCDIIMSAAEDWVVGSAWQLGPSDA